MVAQGGQGPWRPRGSGLLVGVLALSLAALVGHGVLALHLLTGAARAAGATAASRPTVPAVTPSPARPSTSTPSTTASASPTSTPAAPSSGPAPATGPLRLDHRCLVDDNPPPTSAHFPPGDPFGTDISELGKNAELQRLYAVQRGALVPADNGGPVRACDQQLWQVVLATAPPEVLGYVDEFLVFDADLALGQDASVGEVSSLKQSTARSSHWRLALAPNGADEVDVAITVAHEVGHLVSLGARDMTGQDEKSCPGTFLDGCLKDDASLLAFVDDTWGEDELDAWDKATASKDKQQVRDNLAGFYREHEASFVDEYAATHPVEDYAESFALWCAVGRDAPLLPDVVQGKATNGKDKLAWFDQPGNRVGDTTRAGCAQLQQLTR